jgi:TPR repeat protein
MYGYQSWDVFRASLRQEAASAYDEDVSHEQAKDRFNLQLQVLRAEGIKDRVSEATLLTVRPTGRPAKAGKRLLSDPARTDAMEIAKRQISEGLLDEASSTLLEVLLGSDRRSKQAIVDEMMALSEVNASAAFKLGMAYRLGDAGSQDLNKAKTLMQRCVAFDQRDWTYATALTVLGDIESKSGTPQADKKALRFYMKAALTHHSGVAAFNVGLLLHDSGNFALSAKFYLIGMLAGHKESMTNWALMVMRNETRGDREEALRLLRLAAREGDAKAANAVEFFKAHPYSGMRLEEAWDDFDRMPLFMPELAEMFPVAAWLRILKKHGWKLRRMESAVDYELGVFALASSVDGHSIPLHVSVSSHIPGQSQQALEEELTEMFGEDDAIIIFNKVLPMAENVPSQKYICIGRMRIDDEWQDLFLEEGGLETALKQRQALQINPDLDKSVTFYCPDADKIVEQLRKATLRRLNTM